MIDTRTRIAIVGMGAVLPGAADLAAFWRMVSSGNTAVRRAPPGRWTLRVDEAVAEGVAPDRVYSPYGCFLDDEQTSESRLTNAVQQVGVGGLSARATLDVDVLARLDPLYRLLVIAGCEAWADAVMRPIDRLRVGVIVGNIALPTSGASQLAERILLSGGLNPEPLCLNRYVAGLPAGLLAAALGLRGGAYALDAACASSLYAVKLAADELLAQRADAMLAGGVSRPDCLYTQMGFSQLRALSASGRCAPFDHRADGLVVGEGAGVFVLKRLDDALAHGDRIYAVIAGCGLSNDVGGNLMSPDSEGQLRAMRAAYRAAGFAPHEVDLVECHGTGTPIGDAVEFRSMSALWREAEVGRRCAIGSVKSNVGHLLTGAGAAGLVKTLLAMQHETLPPSANFERPARDVSLDGGPFRVLGEATPWPKRMDGQPRRAAVSAFGFGGINAHLVLEEWRESGQWSVGSGQRGGAMSAVRRLVTPDGVPEALDSNIGCPIAVIGVAAHVGPWVDAKAVARRVFGEHDPTPPTLSDNSAHVPLPTDHDPLPRDLRIAALDVPTDQYRIPPAELAEMLPQQLLMLEVAYAAMEDAGIAVNDAPAGGRVDMGVFVGIELDMNTTNFHLRWALPEHARRWARESGRATDGPTFGAWLAELRDEVSPPLSANRTMGALGGIVASRVARLLRVGGPSFAISSEEASGLHAVIAARRALELGELRVALAGAVDLPCDMRAMLAGGDAGDKVVADGAAAVILKRLDDAVADGDRVYAVLGDVTTTSGGPIGDVNDSGGFEAGRLGDCGAASGMVSFVAACLALDRKRLPVSSEGDKAGSPAVRQPQYWLHNRADGPRRATVMTRSVGGGEVGMVVEEATRGGERTGLGIRDSGLGDQPRREALILVCGDGPAEVLAALDRLESQARASGDESIHSLAARAWREGNAAWTSGAGRLCASLVVRDRRELIAIVGDARRAVLGGETLRRDNIAFSPRPLLVRGGSRPWSSLAFVYPGAGSQFLGMGRDWAVEWPDVMRRLDEENERLADQFAGGKFWTAGSRGEIREADVAFGQVWLGALVTDVLARFGVRPGAAIGYSLGESAALFSLRAWRDRDDMLRRMERSPLFTEELAGPCRAARRTWNLPDDEAVDWRLGMVDRPAEEVRRALEHLETTGQARAYLLIVNTPRECVVGGQRAAVERLVADLGCAWHAIDGVTTVHCEVARCVAEDYRRLHLLPTHPPEGVRFYSGSWGRSYELASDAAADSIVAQAVAAFDFTQVIETAYADGARFFLEIGPGASCTRMIGETLGAVGGGREHVALPLCVAPLRSHAALLRVLAVLAAEGYPVDLAPLYDAADEVSCGDADATGRRTMRIDVHRTSFEMASLATPSGYAQTPSGRADTGNTLSADDADFTDGGARLRGGDVGGDVGGGGRVARSNQVVGGGQVASALLACGVGDERRARLLAAAERRGRIVERIVETEREKSLAEERYLLLSARTTTVTAKARAWRAARFLDSAGSAVVEPPSESRTRGDDYGREHAGGAASPMGLGTSGEPPRRLDRDQCLEFATGSIAAVLGPMFAEADKVPTRVRLPDEPLMLVDRIVEIEGEPLSLAAGRVVTEHDVLAGAWYLDGSLDGGRIPTCIAVEAGQADLFLSGYLGIDLRTRGLAVYRLLDAVVTFHGPLPTAGATIQYDIRIERFFRQGETHLFRFRFDATVDGRPLLTMREGCAGFFTDAELAAGQGIVQTTLDRRVQSGVRSDDWRELTPMHDVESLGDEQLAALRAGDLVGCFGEAFAGLTIERPATLPGGRMKLVDRVLRLDPTGGRFGLGQIVGEADIHGDDWFLVCHFVDDQVMPGTLMYECCLHTLRIYLTRIGWVAEADRVAYEPAPGVASQLKCRGQVTAATRRVQYEITLKEVGYAGEEGTPYALADALMYADGKPIVQMNNMSLQMSGARRSEIEAIWDNRTWEANPFADDSSSARPSAKGFASYNSSDPPRTPLRQPPFGRDRILAFAVGKPSVAFGEPYTVFDDERTIARLPGPPYQFLDRIASIAGCRPFELAAGGEIDAEYDVPADAWYFAADRQPAMPFAVLLEVALQPCGWLAAYVGSALASSVDLSFRNLGGRGVQRRAVGTESGTLTTRVKMTSVAKSGGMIIQNYDLTVRDQHGVVYEGDTYFGFFSKQALAHQIGIRDATPHEPSEAERNCNVPVDYPTAPPFPDAMMRMVSRIEVFDPSGGPAGLGFVRGTTSVDPAAWFFQAHFHQDPVWPGSLGLESLLQLLKYVAAARWGGGTADADGAVFESMVLGREHAWTYRGQILPTDAQVVVQAVITGVDDADRRIEADGCLWVDGRLIYQMERFGIRMRGG